MELFKQERAAEEQRNRDNGTPGDVDFQRMVRQYRTEQSPSEKDHFASNIKICICVRKRPISSKEIARKDFDSVTCINPYVVVHDCKFRVDGISKYLDNTSFEVDHSFHENNTTEEVYQYAVQPLVDFVIDGGRATVFAYGQTGSGKTFTMVGIQCQMADELFRVLESSTMHSYTQVFVSFFEIYGGRCQDLLNNRQRLNVREDGGGEVVVSDLMEVEADSAETLQRIIDSGNKNRTTHATESNDVSSRSHAICQIRLVNATTSKEVGRFSLIDLAGSERGADTKSHNRQRRMEGAEINKSLLALKECIRALDGNTTHVPYRGSKLTLVLKDSFTRQNSRTVMIANVSPAASSADHTLNTLRYADRIKDRGQAKRDRDMPTPPPPSSSAGVSQVTQYSSPRVAPKK
jgi:kinesin family protein 2/24